MIVRVIAIIVLAILGWYLMDLWRSVDAFFGTTFAWMFPT